MTPSRLGLMAALGLACLASSVLVNWKAPRPVALDAVLDRIYQ